MPSYRLYGYPQSGSAAVELALAAGDIAHDIIDLDPGAGDLSGAAFLAINPRGQVPALVLPDGTVVTELPAILTHLADAHPGSRLAPPAGTSRRARHDRWLAFTHANIYEGMLRLFYAERYTTDPEGASGVRDAAEAYVLRHFALLDAEMHAAPDDGPFLLGHDILAVDCLVWTLLSWLDRAKVEAVAPRLTVLADAVASDPRFAAVAARHL